MEVLSVTYRTQVSEDKKDVVLNEISAVELNRGLPLESVLVILMSCVDPVIFLLLLGYFKFLRDKNISVGSNAYNLLLVA